MLYRIVAAALVVAAFQNCSRTKTSGQQTTLESNGDSYSGKTFNEYATCPVGDIRATLLARDTDYLLTREDCAPLNPPRPIETARVQRLSGALLMDGRTFRETAPVASAGPVCGYPEYTGVITAATSCDPEPGPSLSRLQATPVDDGVAYVFSMYNVSSATSDATTRRNATKTVTVGNGNAIVDLVLSSYEPVTWRITGNVGAVRSVHVIGTLCATVTGVDLAKVSVKTDENAYGPVLPLSRNRVVVQSVYEGSCTSFTTP